MQWLLLVTMLAGPEPESSEDEQSAWKVAGWGAPAESPAPAEQPTPETEPPAQETEQAWEAAGWGEDANAPGTTDAAPTEGPSATPPSEAEDWSAWDESGDSPDPKDSGDSRDTSKSREFDGKQKVGDILAGSLRLTGSFLRFDDEPALFPNPADAMALTVARVLVEADVGAHVHFSFNGFGELSRVPTGANLGGSFTSAGATNSAYRTRYLTWNFWEAGTVGGQLGVDRASMRLSFDSVNVDIGRFPITYSVSSLFTINDFFAPFSATAVNRIYKPGVDALRISAGIGARASVDVMGVLGYDPETHAPSWGRSAVLSRAAIVGAGFEWAALGGKVSQRWIAGGSLQGDAGPVNLRAEFHVGIPDERGDGHDADDRPIYGRVSAGPSMSFAWQNASISAEYMFASDGAERPGGYIERALASYSDDLPYLGQHYVGAAVGMEIIPILRVFVTGIVSATDGSGLTGVSLLYNVADESDLIVGVFVPWGAGVRGLDPIDPMPGTLALGSEFGLAPISAYLEARVFF